MSVRPLLALLLCSVAACAQPNGRRIVILKVDGMNADMLFHAMQQVDPDTGRSQLPWISRIFGQNGTIFTNFYTRGISLSAPSWSELDTGRHTVIRGNVEFDRYTGHVYDYLNFFPFYIGYARLHVADMPAVEVLDRAGIPLLLDRFPRDERYQSFQLYQRGVRWTTLTNILKRRFSSDGLLSLLEGAGSSFDELWEKQTESEVSRALQTPSIRYVDFFTGDVDHEGHATSDPAAMLAVLQRIDSLCGQLWKQIQDSPQADNTVFAVVSDHGMNNVPGYVSQSFSLPDVLSSAAGGGHHVITDRHEFSDFKLSGLDPLVQRVVNPSRASFYLRDQADKYPTAWLDLDGNERASVCLRNSDVNKLHILLLQISRRELAAPLRAAAVATIQLTIERHRAAWTQTADELERELQALQPVIAANKIERKKYPKRPNRKTRANGNADVARRLDERISAWERETEDYTNYIRHVRALLSLDLQPTEVFTANIADLIPPMSLGDGNSVYDLQHYTAGPAIGGLVLAPDGTLDEERSFVHIDYFHVLSSQTVLNNPQKLSVNPVDFVALRVPAPDAPQVYWLSDGPENQILILKNAAGFISLMPVRHLSQDSSGHFVWEAQPWRAGLPLHLFEDPALKLPGNVAPAEWLSGWHSEREWFEAIVSCAYSNGVIGVTEQFSPVAANVPGKPGMDPILLRYEQRRRELVQPDLQVFAADHWNFNVRNVNPGGNHGSFLRISTHSVWMLSGAGVPAVKRDEPHDSLDFAPCLMTLAGVPDAPSSFCSSFKR